MADNDNISSARGGKKLTAFTSENLLTAVSGINWPCRQILIRTVSGANPSITIQWVDGTTTVYDDLYAGEVLNVQAVMIVSAVNLSVVVVHW